MAPNACFAKTYIFWDMVDYPLPDGYGDPSNGITPIDKFYDTVKLTLLQDGFGGEMEIVAYDAKVDDEPLDPIHRKIRVCRLPDRFMRVSTAAIDMLIATHEGERNEAIPMPTNEINFMLIVKDVVTKEETEVREVIKFLLGEGYGITLVVPDDGEGGDGGIDSAYPYLTDDDLSRITVWNWLSLIEGDGAFVYESSSDDSNQGSSSKRAKMDDASSA